MRPSTPSSRKRHARAAAEPSSSTLESAARVIGSAVGKLVASTTKGKQDKPTKGKKSGGSSIGAARPKSRAITSPQPRRRRPKRRANSE
jgi:hypothetical protein